MTVPACPGRAGRGGRGAFRAVLPGRLRHESVSTSSDFWWPPQARARFTVSCGRTYRLVTFSPCRRHARRLPPPGLPGPGPGRGDPGQPGAGLPRPAVRRRGGGLRVCICSAAKLPGAGAAARRDLHSPTRAFRGRRTPSQVTVTRRDSESCNVTRQSVLVTDRGTRASRARSGLAYKKLLDPVHDLRRQQPPPPHCGGSLLPRRRFPGVRPGPWTPSGVRVRRRYCLLRRPGPATPSTPRPARRLRQAAALLMGRVTARGGGVGAGAGAAGPAAAQSEA